MPHVHRTVTSSLDGLLSRYSTSYPVCVSEVHYEDEEGAENGDMHSGHRERSSMRCWGSMYPVSRHSEVSTVANVPSQVNLSESTPLLGPALSLPPISEEDSPVEEGEPELSSGERYWKEVKILMRYSLPIYGTQLLEQSLIFVSVMSIGHLSTEALAAFTLGSMTVVVTGYSILEGFAGALDTVLPSVWTSDQPQLIGLWVQRMTVILTVLLIPISSIWLNAEPILVLLRQDPEVARLAALYLRWALLGLPAYTFNQISRRYFQSQGYFSIPTRVILVVAPVNALLSYLLVWGPESIRLGFIGAPIATAISFNLMSLSSLLYGAFWIPKTAWHPLSRRMFTRLGILVQLGIAGVGQTASEWWSWELVGLAASQLGSTALAAQSILLVSVSVAYEAPFSLGIATAVRIGNLLGKRKAYEAGIASRTSCIVVLFVEGINSAIFLIFRNKWGYLFNGDPKVANLVASILPLVALFQVVDGLSGVTASILLARGKQATGAVLNLSAYYILGIPLGLWLAFSRDMGLIGLWVGLTVALIYCSTVGLWICLRTDWEREVRKATARMERGGC